MTRAVPFEGERNDDKMRRVVVLPAPLDPIKPNKSPLLIVRSRELRAVKLP